MRHHGRDGHHVQGLPENNPEGVLTLDYPGRRPEARILNLTLPDRGYRCRELLTEPLPRDVTGRAYAESLLNRHVGTGANIGDIGAILAFCGASPLAQEVAQLAVEAGHPPVRLVIFDAAPCTVGTVEYCYQSALRQLGAAPGQTRASVEVAALIERPGKLLEIFARDLTERATAVLLTEGFTESEIAGQVDLTVGMHLDYLAHALAVYHCTFPRWGGEVVHVMSRDHSFIEGWPGARATRIERMSCDHPTLLRDPATRAAVLACLPALVFGL